MSRIKRTLSLSLVQMPADVLVTLAETLGNLGISVNSIKAPAIQPGRKPGPRVKVTFWANTDSRSPIKRTDGALWKVPTRQDMIDCGFWPIYNAAVNNVVVQPASAPASKPASKPATLQAHNHKPGCACVVCQRVQAGAAKAADKSIRTSVKAAEKAAEVSAPASVNPLSFLPAGTTFKVNPDGTFTIV